MLSRKLASDISKKMMEIIPYNVNIMDEKGVIIGSGDSSRLGRVHEGALETLKEKRSIEIEKENGGTKPGVNTPIFFRGDVIGVIGITGKPSEVRQFSKIVSITAELLINQEYSLNEYLIEKKLKEEYIYELLYSDKEYDDDFIQKGKMLDIDISKDRFAIVLRYKKESEEKIKKVLDKKLSKDEFFINIGSDRIALISVCEYKEEYRGRKILSYLKDFNIKIGVGEGLKTIHHSFIQGVKALNIGEKLKGKENIFFYNKIKLFYFMEEFFRKDDNKEIIKRLKREDKELFYTFITYFDMNGEKNNTAKKLHIHRNTLSYRLSKIEEITELSFENYIDLFQYLSSYIGYKLEDICANEQK